MSDYFKKMKMEMTKRKRKMEKMRLMHSLRR
jgi:hypothetical protein